MPTVKVCTKCGVSKPVEAFTKCAESSDGRFSYCRQCKRMCELEWRENHPESIKEIKRRERLKNSGRYKADAKRRYAENREADNLRSAAYYTENRERIKLASKLWKTENPERYAALLKRWAINNPDKRRANSRLQSRKFPDKHNARTAKRRSMKKRAMPAWANTFFISEAYHLARLREKVCGGKWHVDHIVPLQAKLVCGLHVEHNLQVIPGTINQSKSNRRWPDMP